MAKRTKYSRWRRLPGGLSRTSRRQFPDVDDELRPLTLFVAVSALDAAEGQAVRAGAATVQDYCAGLLRRVLDERKQPKRFRLRRASFKGRGLRAEVSGSWERLRDLSYEGRGS